MVINMDNLEELSWKLFLNTEVILDYLIERDKNKRD